jgi:hypothetical protein
MELTMTLVAEQVGLLVAMGLVIFLAVYFGVRMALVHTDIFVRDRERRDLDMRPSVAFTDIAGVGVCICQLADNKTVVVGGVGQPDRPSAVNICRKACDVCGDGVHFVKDCPLVAIARKLVRRELDGGREAGTAELVDEVGQRGCRVVQDFGGIAASWLGGG